jgi:hypothetical protein
MGMEKAALILTIWILLMVCLFLLFKESDKVRLAIRKDVFEKHGSLEQEETAVIDGLKYVVFDYKAKNTPLSLMIITNALNDYWGEEQT